jgi:putative aldouronate transport system substrate-binding protein
MKKLCALALSVAILASIFSACASGGDATAPEGSEAPANNASAEAPAPADDDNFNPTGWPIVKEPITLHVVLKDDTNYTKPYEELELNKRWVEETNVNVEWETMDSVSWNDKVNLLLVSGDLPDVLAGGIPASVELTYAQQGYWQPLQDLIADYTVNLKEFTEMYPDVYKGYYSPDGNVYSLARMKGQEDMEYTNRTFINQEWLSALNLSMPTNVDEFTEVLRAFKTQDPNGNGQPDEIPLAFLYMLKTADRKVDNHRNNLFGLFGLFGRVDSVDHIVMENDAHVFTANKEEYKNAVAWLHQLHTEGLIDPEAFTMDIPAYKAKNTTGDIVYGVWNGWTVEEATNPPEEGIERYAMLPPMTNVNNQQIWPRYGYNVATTGYFMITKDNQYPRETIRWIDYFSDPYVSIEHDWGIEGLGSQINDDGTWEILGGGLTSTRTAEGMSWLLPTLVPKHIYDKCIYTSPVKAFEAEACKVYSPYAVELFPNTYFALEDAQDMTQLNTDIGGYVSQMTAKWIIEGGIEEEWDEYVATLNSLGLPRYEEIYQTTYDRYKAS